MSAAELTDPRWHTYPDTVIEIHSSPVLRIDLRKSVSMEEAVRLRGLGIGDTWAVITAHNPAGRFLDPRENESRAKELDAVIDRSGVDFLRADGVSPDGSHREPGVAAALAKGMAVELGKRFGQSAIFWFDGARFWLMPALAVSVPIRLPVG